MAYPDQPWRRRLRQATFRGAGFHVEVNAQIGGRRIALHEYPKRDEPYAEDMGKRAVRFTVTGYLIGPNYLTLRAPLMAELDKEGPGTLILPTMGPMQVVAEHYTLNEDRQHGGFCKIDMQFTEYGKPGFSNAFVGTMPTTTQAASNNDQAAADSFNSGYSPYSNSYGKVDQQNFNYGYGQ